MQYVVLVDVPDVRIINTQKYATLLLDAVSGTNQLPFLLHPALLKYISA